MLNGTNEAVSRANNARAASGVTLFWIVMCGRKPCRSCGVRQSDHVPASRARNCVSAGDSSV